MSQGNRSLIGNAVFPQTVTAAAHNSNGDGVEIDLSVDPGNTHTFEVNHGAWTDGAHTIHFEHRDEGESFAAIPSEDLDGYDIESVQKLAVGEQTITVGDATKDGTTVLVAYFGGKTFLRVRREDTGVTGAVYGVNVIKSGLRHSGKNPMRDNWENPNT